MGVGLQHPDATPNRQLDHTRGHPGCPAGACGPWSLSASASPAMKMHTVTGRRRPGKGEDGWRRWEHGPRLSTVLRAGRFGEAELSEDHANDNRVLHGSRPWYGYSRQLNSAG